MAVAAAEHAASPALMPSVSVVIPVRDDAPRLAVCLAALAGQTTPADEIIVVDDGSQDTSASVARAAGARVVRSLGGGIAGASATGYDAATSSLIARLDADSVPPPDWIAQVGAFFVAHPGVDAVAGGARFTDGPRLLRRALASAYLGAYLGLGCLALGHPPLFGSNMSLTRASWRRVRAEVHRDDPRVHDDLDLAFHLGLAHRIVWSRGLRMGISMRPFGDVRALIRRALVGAHTIAIHGMAGVGAPRWLRRAGMKPAGALPPATPADVGPPHRTTGDRHHQAEG